MVVAEGTFDSVNANPAAVLARSLASSYKPLMLWHLGLQITTRSLAAWTTQMRRIVKPGFSDNKMFRGAQISL